MVPNSCDLELFSPGPKDPDITAEYGLEGKFVVGYAGAIGPSNALEDSVPQAARILKERGRDDIVFFIAGDGKSLPEIERMKAEWDLDNLILPGSFPKREIPQLPTLTPSGPPLVEVDSTEGVGSLDAEAVVLRNSGGATSLEGWALSTSTGETYVLPALTLFTDGEVRVHTGRGNDTPRDLYWGRDAPAWRAGGLVTLRDAGGNVVDTYIVPGP